MIDTEPLRTLDIKDVYQALGFELRSGNSNARCFGTAHARGDRNPSMGFDTKSNRFKCFACGISGDTIELVQQAHGIEFREATEWLADRFNVPVERVKAKDDKRYIDRPNTPIKRPTTAQLEPIRNTDCTYQLPEHIDVYRAFFEYTADPSDQLRAFWQGRGLSDDLLERVQWRSITKETWQKLAKNFSSKKLKEAGLLTERANGLTPLFYKHTVVVPFFDSDQLIYLRARSLDPTVKAKYLAPRGTSPPIYNYQALAEYDGVRPLYITESETDALALAEQGETALALVGGQKHPDSLVVRELVHVVTDCFTTDLTIHIATDRDDTGGVFFESIAKSFYLAGIPSNKLVKYQCDHAEHKDVADCLRANRTSERPERFNR